MKALFGLSNDDTVKSIVKFYEETYKEKYLDGYNKSKANKSKVFRFPE